MQVNILNFFLINCRLIFFSIFRDVEMSFLNVDTGLQKETVVNLHLKWYSFVENPVEVVDIEQVDFSRLLSK